MSKSRQYKLYTDFGTNIGNVYTNPLGQFAFMKNGTSLTIAAAANYFFITGDKRYYKKDRSTLAIKTMNTYLFSLNNYDVSAYNEFTLSFFVRIPKYVMNECTYMNFPLDGIKWNGGGVWLYEEAPSSQSEIYKGRYVRISCCGVTQDISYNYQAYDGESYIHFAITLLDGMLRFFIDGILQREARISNPNLLFSGMLVGNFRSKSGNLRIDPDRIPVLIFDELAICDRCLWTDSFEVPNRPLMELFPEIIDEETSTSIPSLRTKINSAPNFYSRSKSYWDADLDRAEIVRPDAYKAPLRWKADMIAKHRFNQDDYDYTAKSNWEHLYEHDMWPAGFPVI